MKRRHLRTDFASAVEPARMRILQHVALIASDAAQFDGGAFPAASFSRFVTLEKSCNKFRFRRSLKAKPISVVSSPQMATSRTRSYFLATTTARRGKSRWNGPRVSAEIFSLVLSSSLPMRSIASSSKPMPIGRTHRTPILAMTAGLRFRASPAAPQSGSPQSRRVRARAVRR